LPVLLPLPLSLLVLFALALVVAYPLFVIP
jgi:hypothetical protein